MPEDFSTRELTESELKFGYWFVTHKALLRRALIGFLIAVNAALWGYAGFLAIVEWGVYGRAYAQARAFLPESILNAAGLHESSAPLSLQTGAVTVLSSGEGRYDFLASITNPNERWAVESFQYFFRFSRGQTSVGTTSLLPEESTYAADLGFQSESRPQNAELVISDIAWKRVDAHEVKDVAAHIAQRKNFDIRNILYTPSQESGLSDRAPVSVASFDVYNKTAYNYWQVGLYVVLLRGGQAVGVNFTTADRFLAGENRHMEVRWFESIPSVASVQVIPSVDVLNPDAYMPFQGDGGGR